MVIAKRGRPKQLTETKLLAKIALMKALTKQAELSLVEKEVEILRLFHELKDRRAQLDALGIPY